MKRLLAKALDFISTGLMHLGGYLFDRSYALHPDRSHSYLGPTCQQILANITRYQPSDEDYAIAGMLAQTPVPGLAVYRVAVSDVAQPQLRLMLYRTTNGASPSV